MTRPTVTPTEPVNLVQLDAELGGHGLCRNADTGEITTASESPVTQKQLDDAVAAHAAEFAPDPEEAFRSAVEAASSVADLKRALLGENGPGAEPRRGVAG